MIEDERREVATRQPRRCGSCAPQRALVGSRTHAGSRRASRSAAEKKAKGDRGAHHCTAMVNSPADRQSGFDRRKRLASRSPPGHATIFVASAGCDPRIPARAWASYSARLSSRLRRHLVHLLPESFRPESSHRTRRQPDHAGALLVLTGRHRVTTSRSILPVLATTFGCASPNVVTSLIGWLTSSRASSRTSHRRRGGSEIAGRDPRLALWAIIALTCS